MKRAALLLVAAILVAGCTVGGGDGDDGEDTPQVRGLVVQEASIVEPTVGLGQSTELILRVANTNPTAVGSFSADVSNSGPITVTGNCDLGTIPAATGTTPTRETCVWTLETSDMTADDVGTYPLALTIDYETTLTMTGNSPKFTFTRDLPSRDTVSGTFTNQELSMETTHRPEYASDTSSVSIDIALEETGSGEIRMRDGIRQVELDYGGSLLDVFGYQSEERCTTANFLSGSSETSITCVLTDEAQQGGVSAGTTYNLRVNATYEYERYTELSFEVVEGN